MNAFLIGYFQGKALDEIVGFTSSPSVWSEYEGCEGSVFYLNNSFVVMFLFDLLFDQESQALSIVFRRWVEANGLKTIMSKNAHFPSSQKLLMLI